MATTYTRTAVAPFGAVTVHRVVTALSGVVATLRAWNDNRRTIVALRALSAAQLDDIGLTRNDVAEFGRKGFRAPAAYPRRPIREKLDQRM